MSEAYKDYFKRYVDFKGTTTLSGYWWVVLVNVIIGFILSLLGNVGNVITTIYSLAILVPSLAITIRRLRDACRSVLNILWIFVPIVGWILLLICLASRSR